MASIESRGRSGGGGVKQRVGDDMLDKIHAKPIEFKSLGLDACGNASNE